MLFPLNFLVGGGFLLTDSFHRFLNEKPGGLHENLVCRGSLHDEIGWRSLCFAQCLFICLLFVYLLLVSMFAFLITLRELFVGSCISFVV